jgi:hypothetical protein
VVYVIVIKIHLPLINKVIVLNVFKKRKKMKIVKILLMILVNWHQIQLRHLFINVTIVHLQQIKYLL